MNDVGPTPDTIKFFELVDRAREENKRRRPRPPMAGAVYLIGAVARPTPIKIGVSVDVAVRLHMLQSSSPVLLEVAAIYLFEHIDIAGAVERRAHRQFSAFRSHGEWFNVEATVIGEWIAQNFGDLLNAVGNQRPETGKTGVSATLSPSNIPHPEGASTGETTC